MGAIHNTDEGNKMTKIFKNTEEAGRSMVEMLGVLAIVGVLSIGGIAGYSKAMAKYKTNKVLDQVSMLITNVRTTFGNQVSYYGLTTENAKTYEIISSDMMRGSDAKNAFDGAITIKAGNADGSDCTENETYCPTFVIEFDGIEPSACGTIAMADWGGSVSSGLVKITIGSTDFTWNASGDEKSLPINFSDAATACAVSGNDTTTAITWVYN